MTECGSREEWECCLHSTLSFTFCVLFCFPFSFTLSLPFFIPLPLISFPWLLCTCPHRSFSLPLSLDPLLSGSGHLKCSSLSTIQLLSGPPTALRPPPPIQRLPFPHSANLSPWNLSNSPCTHSAVPLISCSLHPPLLHFLALSALAA